MESIEGPKSTDLNSTDWLGIWRSTPVAIKQIKAPEHKEIRSFVAEILLMKKLRVHGKLVF